MCTWKPQPPDFSREVRKWDIYVKPNFQNFCNYIHLKKNNTAFYATQNIQNPNLDHKLKVFILCFKEILAMLQTGHGHCCPNKGMNRFFSDVFQRLSKYQCSPSPVTQALLIDSGLRSPSHSWPLVFLPWTWLSEWCHLPREAFQANWLKN